MNYQQALNVIENSIVLDTKIPEAEVVELLDCLNAAQEIMRRPV